MTNSPQDAAEIAARLHRISGLTDNQIASLSLTLDPTQVDQVSDGVLAALVSGTLPGLPLNPAGGLPLGLPGAVQPSRYVGATTSGPPTTGTFAIGDFVIVRTGGISICTVAGTPGTWVTPTGGGAGAPPLADVLAAATSSGALTVGKHNPVDTSGGAKAMTLANASSAGLLTTVEKTDSSANAVTVTLNLRGTPASTLSLSWQNEAIELLSKADGSWWPVAGHRTKASLDAAYVKYVSGTLSAQPTASTFGVGLYWASDDNSGTLYRSDGTSWTKQAPGVGQAATPARVTLATATANITTTSTSDVDAAGLSVTWTAVAGATYRLEAKLAVGNTTAGQWGYASLTDSSNTVLDTFGSHVVAANDSAIVVLSADVSPAAGSVTYKCRLRASANTGFILAGSTFPARLGVLRVA